ncbi:MAG: aminodeoxychorismate/anthranilate synthase component II [Candidatus Saganbacteria bacterium]|nr:aminodeoxychorismate/anthranilate synthase component II [Candidatus Saganbacteria bacterium]
MILMIDNYDSFTYNLVQYMGELGEQLEVHRNDKITIEIIEKLAPNKIIISPGPGGPKDAGISLEVVKSFSGKIPLLGVCLGHQVIGEAFGAKIVRAENLMHGKTSQINHDGKTIFRDLSNPFAATRYHSLIIKKDTLPDCFEISAKTDQGEIMGIRHRIYPLEGVQFHPESILTTEGKKLLKNFLSL